MKITQEKISYQKQVQAGWKSSGQEAPWLEAKRRAAWERFQATGFPGRHHESWKYLYLEGILNTSFQKDYVPAYDSEAIKQKLLPFQNENRVVFINGIYHKDFSNSEIASPALQARNDMQGDIFGANLLSPSVIARRPQADEAISGFFAKNIATETNPFVSLNTAYFQEGFFLDIPPDTSSQKPLHLIFLSVGDNASSPVFYPRVLIHAGAGAHLEVIFHHMALNDQRYFANSVVEFSLEPSARVTAVNRQEAGREGIEFLNFRISLQAASHFEMNTYVSGGSIVRDEVIANLIGPEALVSLNALSLMEGQSQVFHQVHVDHHSPQAASQQVYKNILAGKSVAEFNSLVHVHRDARKSDSTQLDKNLLLSDQARVYSRPQLKIDNDDVRANHGAATGQLQKNEIFYLQSRGLDRETARYLLIDGFAKEIIEKFKPDWLRKELEAVMEQKIRQLVSVTP